MQTADKVGAAILIVTFMLQAGLTAQPRLLREEVEHPQRVLRGVFFFLVLQPIVAAFAIRLFRLHGPVAAAIALLSTTGVMPLAARSADKAKGAIGTGLVLTFVLGVVAIFTAPPTAAWLVGSSYTGDVTDLHPARLIGQLLLLQGAPLLIGLAIRSYIPRAQGLAKVIGWISAAAFIAVALLIVLPQLGALAAIGWRGALAGIVFAVAVAAVGYGFGGTTVVESRTLAVLANIPNVALAIAIATTAGLPHVFSVTILGMFLLRIIVGAFVNRVLSRRAAPGVPGERHAAH